MTLVVDAIDLFVCWSRTYIILDPLNCFLDGVEVEPDAASSIVFIVWRGFTAAAYFPLVDGTS